MPVILKTVLLLSASGFCLFGAVYFVSDPNAVTTP